MITVKCIGKIRDKSGKIIGYRLQDINGQTQEASAESLKKAIKNKSIHIINLRLTSDNRLVNSSEKQLQSVALKKPLTNNDTKEKHNANLNCAKALIYINTQCLMGMGDSLRDLADSICSEAGMDIDTYDMSDKQIEKALVDGYTRLAKDKPSSIADEVGYWFENDDDETIKNCIANEQLKDIKQSKIYKSLNIILNYLKDKGQPVQKTGKLEALIKEIESQAMDAINKARSIGNNYWKYLDSSLFGTISNNSSVVGSTVDRYDIAKFDILKNYIYICHKDINKVGSPKLQIAIIFRRNDNGIIADFRFERLGYVSEKSMGVVSYSDIIIKSSQFQPQCSIELCSKSIADICNKLVPKMYEMAKANPKLNELEPLRT